MEIEGRTIGPDQPPYVIAELSGNHNGEIARALKLIDAAQEAGADAVKLQTYTADTITIDHDGPGFRIEGGLWDGRSLHELYEDAHTPWEWHPELFEYARERGITIFSSPFDTSAIDFLEGLNAPAYKIASFEAIDLPLIQYAAKTGKPLVISTGMCTPEETDEAVQAARTGNNGGGLALLHCVSAYPAPADEANLRTIPNLASRHGITTGLSDHTLGTAVAVAAVAQGACIIEKHVTLARADGGPDAAFSLEPGELKILVEDCRTAWAALGVPRVVPEQSEKANVQFRRSLYAVADIKAGDVLTEHNVRSIRPGYGLAPKLLPEVLGRKAKSDITRGTPLDLSLLEDGDDAG